MPKKRETKVIKETKGGAQNNPEVMAKTLKDAIAKKVKYFENVQIEGLLNSRYEKFRKIK